MQHAFAKIKTGRLCTIDYDGYSTRPPLPDVIAKDFFPKYSNIAVTFKTSFAPGTKIYFWAALPRRVNDCHPLRRERRAFGNFSNSGLTTVQENQYASCILQSPQPYTIEPDNVIGKHMYLRRSGRCGWTTTTYSVSVVPTFSTTRRVRPLLRAPTLYESIFHPPDRDGAAVATNFREMKELTRNGHVDVFFKS